MSHDVFVSYAQADKAAADAVVADLEGHGIRCWIAPRDVPPGAQYMSTITQAVKSSQVLVLVFSRATGQSPHVPREVELAVASGLAIIPLRLDSVTPSGDLEYALAGTHWLDALTPPLQSHLARLREAARLLIAAPGDTEGANRPDREPDVASSPTSEPTSRRPAWMWATAASVVVVAILGLAMLLRGGGSGNETSPSPGSEPAPAQTQGSNGALTSDQQNALRVYWQSRYDDYLADHPEEAVSNLKVFADICTSITDLDDTFVDKGIAPSSAEGQDLLGDFRDDLRSDPDLRLQVLATAKVCPASPTLTQVTEWASAYS